MAAARTKPWTWPGAAQARINQLETKVDAQAEALRHAIGIIGAINHNVNDISRRLEDIQIDAESVTAMASAFRRFAADLTDELEQAMQRLGPVSGPDSAP